MLFLIILKKTRFDSLTKKTEIILHYAGKEPILSFFDITAHNPNSEIFSNFR